MKKSTTRHGAPASGMTGADRVCVGLEVHTLTVHTPMPVNGA